MSRKKWIWENYPLIHKFEFRKAVLERFNARSYRSLLEMLYFGRDLGIKITRNTSFDMLFLLGTREIDEKRHLTI